MYFISNKNNSIDKNKAIRYHLANINNIPSRSKIFIESRIHKLSKLKGPQVNKNRPWHNNINNDFNFTKLIINAITIMIIFDLLPIIRQSESTKVNKWAHINNINHEPPPQDGILIFRPHEGNKSFDAVFCEYFPVGWWCQDCY